jgi:hypothetical protein
MIQPGKLVPQKACALGREMMMWNDGIMEATTKLNNDKLVKRRSCSNTGVKVFGPRNFHDGHIRCVNAKTF